MKPNGLSPALILDSDPPCLTAGGFFSSVDGIDTTARTDPLSEWVLSFGLPEN
jgi:hypothetical protein